MVIITIKKGKRYKIMLEIIRRRRNTVTGGVVVSRVMLIKSNDIQYIKRIFKQRNYKYNEPNCTYTVNFNGCKCSLEEFKKQHNIK